MQEKLTHLITENLEYFVNSIFAAQFLQKDAKFTQEEKQALREAIPNWRCPKTGNNFFQILVLDPIWRDYVLGIDPQDDKLSSFISEYSIFFDKYQFVNSKNNNGETALDTVLNVISEIHDTKSRIPEAYKNLIIRIVNSGGYCKIHNISAKHKQVLIASLSEPYIFHTFSSGHKHYFLKLAANMLLHSANIAPYEFYELRKSVNYMYRDQEKQHYVYTQTVSKEQKRDIDMRPILLNHFAEIYGTFQLDRDTNVFTKEQFVIDKYVLQDIEDLMLIADYEEVFKPESNNFEKTQEIISYLLFYKEVAKYIIHALMRFTVKDGSAQSLFKCQLLDAIILNISSDKTHHYKKQGLLSTDEGMNLFIWAISNHQNDIVKKILHYENVSEHRKERIYSFDRLNSNYCLYKANNYNNAKAAAYIEAHTNYCFNDPQTEKIANLRQKYHQYYNYMYLPSWIMATTSLALDVVILGVVVCTTAFGIGILVACLGNLFEDPLTPLFVDNDLNTLWEVSFGIGVFSSLSFFCNLILSNDYDVGEIISDRAEEINNAILDIALALIDDRISTSRT